MDQEVEEKLAAQIKKLQDYEATVGLKSNNYSGVADKYLQLTQDQISKMSADECGEAAYLLSQYGLYIQRELNKQRSIIHWAQMSIDRIISPKIGQYEGKFMSNDIKKMLAIQENPTASELLVIKVAAENRANMLADLSYKIGGGTSLAQTLGNLQQTKRRKND